MSQGNAKYILGDRIAQGGMAEIYIGKIVGSEGFTRICAFKKVLQQFMGDAEFIEMFKQEALLAKQLQHKNIVQVLDFDSDNQQGSVLMMEYVDGQDLRSILKETEQAKKRIPVDVACYICAEILSGLSYAHTAIDFNGKPLGIIHRDISPQNILISYEGDVKITDFGIAKVQSAANVTKTGVLKGKFRYMSPEQANGKSIDCRSDIFAVGIILYELLTMSRLFKGNNDLEIIQNVRECNIKSPNQVKNTKIPAELESIIMKLLSKEVAGRYQSAKEAAKELTRFLYKFKPDFFSGELTEFMSQIFSKQMSASREKIRSTLALPIDFSRATYAANGELPDFSLNSLNVVGKTAQQALNEHSLSMLKNPQQGHSTSTGNKHDMNVSVDTSNTVNPLNNNIPGQVPFPQNTAIHKRGGVVTPQKANVGKNSPFKKTREHKTSKKGTPLVTMFFVMAFALVVIGFFVRNKGGSLASEVTLVPGAGIFKRVQIDLNGKAVDNGELVELPKSIVLAPGNNEIIIKRLGFNNQVINGSSALLSQKGKISVLLEKQSQLANLLIVTQPDGASINIDNGLFLGFSGKHISYIPAGRQYKIKVEHSRCKSYTGTFYIPPQFEGKVFTKNIVLGGCK